ncbi:MAG: M20/M25/M40 family metallo-hydrolase [Gemmatimonadales bacterium]
MRWDCRPRSTRSATSPRGGPVWAAARRWCIMAHMDTVHPMDTDVRAKRDGAALRALGIFDNSASVANMLAMARAMQQAKVRTRGHRVRRHGAEELLGLMDGVVARSQSGHRNPDRARRRLAVGQLRRPRDLLDPVPLHRSGVAHQHVGGQAAPGPGPGRGDPVDLRDPDSGRPGAVYNVGMPADGLVFNAIPQDEFTVDLRSVNPTLLDSLDHEIAEAGWPSRPPPTRSNGTRSGCRENQAGGTAEMLAGRRSHPLIQTALDVHQHFGVESRAVPSGSTDANMGVVRGIPSISIGRSLGGDQHTLTEWADWKLALPATQNRPHDRHRHGRSG